MEIKTLSLRNFRNYAALDVAFSPRVNLVYGENAQGKTNLLEAVCYFSGARSPRSRFDRELVSFGAPEASLRKQGAKDIIVFVGGVIPPQDYAFLYDAGVKGIYGPGTPVPASAKDVLEQIKRACAAG